MRARMAMMTCGLLVACLVMPMRAAAQVTRPGETVDLSKGWRFAPGDGLERAQPGFDDSSWKPLGVDKVWEEQGYEKLDGYAWYRLHFRLPARLRAQAAIQDGVRLCVGKINNYDQTFLNGRIVGANAKNLPAGAPLDDSFTKADPQLYNVERCYVLAPDDQRLAWDGDNVLAVRVFDEGGLGGMWSGAHEARMVALADYLTLDVGSQPFRFDQGGLSKTIVLSNGAGTRSLRGTVTITGTGKLSGAPVYDRKIPFDLAPSGGSRELTLAFAAGDESVVVNYAVALEGDGSGMTRRQETPYILTPPAPEVPRINGAAVLGARPGRSLLYAIAATGARPMTFAAEKLPAGLSLDPATGVITGSVAVRGEYPVTLVARNARGEARRTLKIVVGDRLALTPPMGWNSWNAWGVAVDQEKVVHSALAFVGKGLRDHGWTYINIDDGWEIKGDAPQAKRTSAGDIIVNGKFSDMKALGDRLHGMGLKFGIYSSPGPLTCGQYTGSYQHEVNDARTYASWGVDYLKYDWCSYDGIAKDQSLPQLRAPYDTMRHALDGVNRDIVYSLCQYGTGRVWEWGDSAGGNLWRTTEDITDTWESMRDIGFNQVENARFAGPGHWNDPDMLVVGWVGWGPSLHPTALTPDEQYTHISLWALLSAPLLIGADLDRLDPFTLNLLTNDEVIAVDQDPLGRPATPVVRQQDIQVWVKEMADGSKTVGVFNLGGEPRRFDLNLASAGLPDAVRVRDVWRQKDLGVARTAQQVTVPSHGVVLLNVRPR